MKENPLLNALFKSVLDQDPAPVVICDLDSVIRYMNPASIAIYRRDLTGRSVMGCHNPDSCQKIRQVLDWFAASPDNNLVYTARDDEENKDIYMVALRDENRSLIGYYEKHEYRTRETVPFYDM